MARAVEELEETIGPAVIGSSWEECAHGEMIFVYNVLTSTYYSAAMNQVRICW